MKKNTEENVLKFVSIDQDTGCWNWTGYKNPQGYGRVRWRGKLLRAHRWSYEYYNGPIQEGLVICHTCDNTSCINPEHLFQGTRKENSEDRDRKGRFVKLHGSDNGFSKLTEKDVVVIKKFLSRHDEPGTLVFLGNWFGVTATAISKIKRQETWCHV